LRKSKTVTYIAHKVALVVDANEDFCYTHYTFKGDTPDRCNPGENPLEIQEGISGRCRQGKGRPG
jgi:hypothetical protein